MVTMKISASAISDLVTDFWHTEIVMIVAWSAEYGTPLTVPSQKWHVTYSFDLGSRSLRSKTHAGGRPN